MNDAPTPSPQESELDHRIAGPFVRSALLQLFDKVAANRPGALIGEDISFLHRVRTSTRRTRSALSEVRGVLSDDVVAHFKEEFRWLQRVTGDKRDLDVLRVKWAALRLTLSPDTLVALEPFERGFPGRAVQLQRDVVRELESDRWTALERDWRAELTRTDHPDPTLAPQFERPVLAVAQASVWRAWKRLRKRGRRIGDSTPVAEIHEARIAAKRLRYVLALFADVFEFGAHAAEFRAEVRDLKAMQDVLGELNDLSGQQSWFADAVALDAVALNADVDVVAVRRGLEVVRQRIDARFAEVRPLAAAHVAQFVFPGRHARYRRLFKT